MNENKIFKIIIVGMLIIIAAFGGFKIIEKSLILQSSQIDVAEEGVPARLGDTVVIDYVGTVDGVEFEGGSAVDYSLILGSQAFIPGFEEQLVGAVKGEEVIVEVTFPEDYASEELAGQNAIFEVNIKEIYLAK